MRTSTRLSIAIALMSALFAAPAAVAQDSGSDKWTFSIEPYLWATDLSGQLTLKGVTVPVDVSFDDVLDELDSGLSLHFEASRKKWGLFLDTTKIKLSSEFEGPIAPGVSALDYSMVEAAVFRRRGGERGGWDVLFGLRYWDFEQTVTRFLSTPIERSVSGSQSWTDLMVGFRYLARPGKRWIIAVRYDIAGLGSELTWNTSLMFNYLFPKLVSIEFGYRLLDLDYQNGEGDDRFAMDLQMDGPVLGVGFRF